MGEEKKEAGLSLDEAGISNATESERALLENMQELPVSQKIEKMSLFSPLLQKIAKAQTEKAVNSLEQKSVKFEVSKHARPRQDSESKKDLGRIKIMENMLKERETMLSQHEKKVISLKTEFDKKVNNLALKEKELEERENALEQKEKHISKSGNAAKHVAGHIKRMQDEENRLIKRKQQMQSELEKYKENIELLKKAEKAAQDKLAAKESLLAKKEKSLNDLSKKHEMLAEKAKMYSDHEKTHSSSQKEIETIKQELSRLTESKKILIPEIQGLSQKKELLEKREKTLSEELARKEKDVKEREKKLDDMLEKINTAGQHIAKKEKELQAAAAKMKELMAHIEENTKKLRHLEDKHAKLMHEVSDRSLKEAERLVEKSHEHLKKGEVMAAKYNYERIRELYSHLSREKKYHLYKKIDALTKKIEAYWHLKNFSS